MWYIEIQLCCFLQTEQKRICNHSCRKCLRKKWNNQFQLNLTLFGTFTNIIINVIRNSFLIKNIVQPKSLILIYSMIFLTSSGYPMGRIQECFLSGQAQRWLQLNIYYLFCILLKKTWIGVYHSNTVVTHR